MLTLTYVSGTDTDSELVPRMSLAFHALSMILAAGPSIESPPLWLLVEHVQHECHDWSNNSELHVEDTHPSYWHNSYHH